ncbi:MAG: DUF2304 family protein [Nanoarchaeota archaeon]|nr:DUF2304 family protein [Nanoarchaeota archaeon]
MVMLLQVVGVIFALGMLFLTYLHFKRKEFAISDFLVWLLVWVGFVLVLVFPESVKFVFQSLAIQGPLWFLTIAAILFLTVLVFYLHFTVRKGQMKLADIVKSSALKHVEPLVEESQNE